MQWNINIVPVYRKIVLIISITKRKEKKMEIEIDSDSDDSVVYIVYDSRDRGGKC